VRTDELTLLNNTTTANDRLLVSRDGGESWIPVIQRHAKLLGFALSPDGGTVLAGYGDPVLFTFAVDVADVGIYRYDLDELSSAGPDSGLDAGAPFTKILDHSTTCLRWTPDTLYACFTQQQVGFEVGVSASEQIGTATTLVFSPLLDLSAVRPLQCAEDSSARQCLDDIIYGWPVACAKLGAPCDLEQDDSDAGPAAPPAAKDSGCNCRLSSTSGSDVGGTLLALFIALVAAVRRRLTPSPECRMDT
jgi:hypothetical protein